MPTADPDCGKCRGFGWYNVVIEGVSRGMDRCDCFRLAIRRIKLDAIPPEYQVVLSDALQADAERHLLQAEALAAMTENPSASFVLCGRHGSGKTMLGWWMYRKAVLADMPAVGVTATRLLDQFRHWQFHEDDLPMITAEALHTHERTFVFIDELDKPKPTEFAAEQMYELLNAAYSFRHQLVVTSNLKLGDLATRWDKNIPTIGGSIVRRLMEIDNGYLVEMF